MSTQKSSSPVRPFLQEALHGPYMGALCTHAFTSLPTHNYLHEQMVTALSTHVIEDYATCTHINTL